MSSKGFHTAMLVAWICLGAAASLPFLRATTLPSSQRTFSKSSASTVLWRQKDGKPEATRIGNDESSIPIGVNVRLPPSPANLLKPDGFQFYAYNERGDMITKQMSTQDIQALIASGGPIHSNLQPQKADDILTGGKKVMDVVEKVQNVLKSAMGKPFYSLTDSIPTVPEKESAEWSNILPGILAGDKFEETTPTLGSTYSSDYSLVKLDTPETSTAKLQQQSNTGGDSVKQTIDSFAVTREPTITLEPTTDSSTERLMIPVSVITAKDKPESTPKASETVTTESSPPSLDGEPSPLAHSSTVEAEATRYATVSPIPMETSASDGIATTILPLNDNEALLNSSTTTQAIETKLSATPHVKPLSEELADSLSSVINQVSENVPSVLLSDSSDVAQAEQEKEEKENSATSSIIDDPASTTNHEDISTWTVGELEEGANVTSDGAVKSSTPPIANSSNLSAPNPSKWALAAIHEILEQQMASPSPERKNSTPNGVVALVLPDISQNVPTKTLASSLIAGFGPVDSNAPLNQSSFEADAPQPTAVSPIAALTTHLLNEQAPSENFTTEGDPSSLPTTERQTASLEITTNSDPKYFEAEAESVASATTAVTDETLATRTPAETEEDSSTAASVQDFPNTLLDSRDESSERNASRGGEPTTLPLPPRASILENATPSPAIISETSTKVSWTKETENATVVYESVSKNRNESLVSTTNSGGTTESGKVSVEGEKGEEEVGLKSETSNGLATVRTSNSSLNSEAAPAPNSKEADATEGSSAESVEQQGTSENSGSVKETDVESEEKWQRIPLTSKFASATVAGTGTESTLALDSSKNVGGLDGSTKNTSIDVVNFSRLCNELAFKFWIAANKGLSSGRSLALSPFGMLTLLSMIFLGARGSTSEQMNEILGLDNVATFNPHLIFQNVTDAVSLARQQRQGIANAAFVRELFADKAKIRKLMPFYKEQAQQFYEGLVAEVNFATISDLARRRTNLLIRKQTGGRIKDFARSNAVPLRSPLAAISANVFQTDCNASLASTKGRDGELYFAVSSGQRLRKLVPVPATVWRANVLAGYEPSLDATAVALGGPDKLVSAIFLLPGQGQGHAAPGDTLDRLEQRLVEGETALRDRSWDKLLRVLVPRNGLELQIPKFSHRSVVNATSALKRMGLDQLFSSDADFRGINGIGNRLFLSDVLQMNLFSTCGDESIANGRHHVETYPASPTWRNSRSNAARSLAATGSPAKSEHRAPRLKLDQPFLYFVRHNPTGLLLHMGRFNPRLL